MDKEEAILKSISDLADYLEDKERRRINFKRENVRLLRKIKDRIYTVLNPMPNGQEGNCCEMPKENEGFLTRK